MELRIIDRYTDSSKTIKNNSNKTIQDDKFRHTYLMAITH